MKRQIQKPGVRKWYADDFLKLQNQLYDAIEKAITGDVDNVILKGCVYVDFVNPGHYSITPGYCKIGGKICFTDTPIDVDHLPAYLQAEEIETNTREYADGQNKPTEVHYKIKVSYTSNGGNEIPIDPNNIKSRFKPVFIDKDGNIKNLPVSNSNTSNTDKSIALSSAVYKNLRRYIKENFDTGEIDASQIPAGHTWLGKNGLVKIDHLGQMFLEALTANAEIIAEVLEANTDITAGQDISAGGKVSSANPMSAPNAPKILIFVEDDAGVLNTLGSVEVQNSQVTSGGTGIYNVDITVPQEAIMFASLHQTGNVNTIAAYRHPTSGKPVVEIKDSNNNYVNDDFSLLIYY